MSNPSASVNARYPVYVYLAVAYLWLSDLWLVYFFIPNRLFPLGVFALFAISYLWEELSAVVIVSSRTVFLYFWLNLAFLIGLHLSLDLGISHKAVLTHYVIASTYILVGMALSQRLSLRQTILVLAVPLIFRAAVSLPYMLRVMADVGAVLDTHQAAMSAYGIKGALKLESFRWGVGTFSLYTAMSVITVLLIAIMPRMSPRIRLFVQIICIPILLTVILSSTQRIPLLVVFVGSVYSVFLKNRRALVPAVVLIVLLLVVLSAYVPFMYDLVDRTKNTIESILNYGVIHGDDSGRAWRFLLSYHSFLSSPIIGIGPYDFSNTGLGRVIGGHSTIIDWPAQYGLLGIAVIIGMGWHFWKAGVALNKRGRVPEANIFRVTLPLMFMIAVVNPLLLQSHLDQITFTLLGYAIYINYSAAHQVAPAPNRNQQATVMPSAS